ncbi:hypothetical protein MGYG_06781 [Nannizzia gypsea CBS 118893]|uniref:Uncharacterized protein n=1 Tax=Arthroderma gypseum (strain ATCC MYA-4604 / CBS 118893) TaxID=535722 RepID=E4V168_ARTGP|nr:hypothetical protein MGYG_06781 [Nannizzia gypsea CBS 118893]EFR03783.1 hypothetical protein MGYG_06781 [Nannizzia gypsea CBS 118893]
MAWRHIILTGAPVPSSLCWEEAELQETAGDGKLNRGQEHRQPADEARWRSLETARGTTALTGPVDEGGWFFTAGAVQRYSGESVSGLETTALSAFYEQSFALHEEGASFDHNNNKEDDEDTRSFGGDDSTGLADSVEGDLSSLLPAGSQFRSTVRPHLSDLEDIPKAAYVHGLSPRVVAVNLIVAVITVEQRRRVRTRWGRAMDLVELLVGDETKSGFRISCWLPPRDGDDQQQQQQRQETKKNPLEEALEGVRPCDIVLLRSVALGAFRDQVYGQSLRNNMTRLDLLHRRPVDGMDSEGLYPGQLLEGASTTGGHDPQMAKVARVKSWMLEFIGPARQQVNELPPDTQ